MIDPLSITIISGLVGAALGAITVIYWKNIAKWIKTVYNSLPFKIKKELQGAVSFIKRVGNSFSNIMKYYSHNKEINQWKLTTVTQEVDESTIPEHIRAKLTKNSEIETTQELEKELKMSLS